MKRCASKKPRNELIINRRISLHCTKLLSGIQMKLEKMKQNLTTLHPFHRQLQYLLNQDIEQTSDTSRTDTD